MRGDFPTGCTILSIVKRTTAAAATDLQADDLGLLLVDHLAQNHAAATPTSVMMRVSHGGLGAGQAMTQCVRC